LQALWSAARYQAAAAFVVLNNSQYKILRLIAERDELGEGVPGLDLPDLDILQAAKSLGCEGERVERPEELSDALERTLGTGHPYVLEILVDPDVPKSME